jgi:uncharacterized protein YjbI with pentapeptide repeats
MKLTESTLRRIVRRLIKEETENNAQNPKDWGGKRPSQEEIKAMCELHAKFLDKDPEGTQMQFVNADFSNCKIRTFFSNMSLNWAKFISCNFVGSDFRSAPVKGCDFSESNMQGTLISGNDLMYTKFIKANLKSAIISPSMLYNTDFTGADLTNADIRGLEDERDVYLFLKASSLENVVCDRAAVGILKKHPKFSIFQK